MAILMPLSKRILWSLLIKYFGGKEIKEAYESNRKPLLLVLKIIPNNRDYLKSSQFVPNMLPVFINCVCIPKQACKLVGVWHGPESFR